ncbi:MAG: ribosome recycling factor [Phototrophicaceae bacterium]
MLNDILEYHEDRMKSTLSVFEEDLIGIRGNRASTGLVDRLMVEYYGQETELRKIANISTPEPMTIAIRPFDPTAVSAIETAINKANLGVNPNSDGGMIHLNMPTLNRERRIELVKMLGRRTEDARVAIRNIRRDAMKDVQELEKEGEIGEDESKGGQEKVEDLTKSYVGKIDTLSKTKETDIMDV